MRLFSNTVCWLLIISVSGCESSEKTALTQRPVKIIAHRGMHKSAPGNTLAAIRAAVERELDYVELDVRTTADGYLVLMHDETIDRTTTGSGPVAEVMLEQIRKVTVKPPKGSIYTDEKIPLFSEALQYMSGKIDVYVDMKDADYNAVFAELEQHNMLNGAVIYVYVHGKELSKMHQSYPKVKIMPEVDSEKELAEAMKLIHPEIVAMSWRGFSEELIKKIHKADAKVFLDILGDGDNPEGVSRVIEAGVDGIQTDDPDMVLRVINQITKRQGKFEN